MKKLVLKTVAITLASVIGALLLAFGCFALLSPGVLGKVFDGAGMYSASVFFYEKEYERTGDIDDLNRLVLTIDEDKDYALAEKYYKEIIEHKDFSKLCEVQTINGKVTAKEYYYGNYALSVANNGKFSDALQIGKEFVSDNYTAYNPLRVLIYDYVSAERQQEITEALGVLQSLTVTDGQTYLSADINYLNGLING